MNTLVVTVGLPRSGKSTWAKTASKQLRCPIVNPDAVRWAITGQRFVKSAEPIVWATVRYMVRALFLAGHNTVILDATNVTKSRRKFWLDEAKNGHYGKESQVNFVLFLTDPEVCKERAIETEQADLLPVIDSMYEIWEPVEEEEGPSHNVNDVFSGLMGLI